MDSSYNRVTTLLCGLSCFLSVYWPPFKDNGAEVATAIFVQPVNTMEITFRENSSMRQHSYIPEYRVYTGLGMVAGESSNLH